jgi:hypothetical protein
MTRLASACWRGHAGGAVRQRGDCPAGRKGREACVMSSFGHFSAAYLAVHQTTSLPSPCHIGIFPATPPVYFFSDFHKSLILN